MVKTLLYEKELLTEVQRRLKSARQFKIATAMISAAGVNRVDESIRRCLQKGGSGEILIGIDLPSDPKAMQELLRIESNYAGRLQLKVFRRLKNRIFHPKLFIFKGRNGKRSAIIGSSNLTCGGLTENYEVNVLVEADTVAGELSDYFDENFQGAYSEDLTSEWIEPYFKEWVKRKKLLDKLCQPPPKNRARAHMNIEKVDTPKRISGYRFAFTGGIPDWPRARTLYPCVRKLGGSFTEAEHIASADCLVHGEVMSGRKTTRKLRGARQNKIPVISQEEFMALVAKERDLRKRGQQTRTR
jgi:HKD family nuclease